MIHGICQTQCDQISFDLCHFSRPHNTRLYVRAVGFAVDDSSCTHLAMPNSNAANVSLFSNSARSCFASRSPTSPIVPTR